MFEPFQLDLELHMLKEERVLFSLFRQLEEARTRLSAPCGGLENPLHVMIHEHEHAGTELAAMRALTHGFTPPADTCTTDRVMLDALAHVEREMHQHVHLENNILCPRAVALAATLAGA